MSQTEYYILKKVSSHPVHIMLWENVARMYFICINFDLAIFLCLSCMFLAVYRKC